MPPTHSPVCAGCEQTLPPPRRQGNPRKWCSEACRVRTVRKPYRPAKATTRTCRYCNTEFTAKGYRFRCHECTHLGRTGPPRPCSWCGDDFYPRTSPDRTYCGRSCAASATAERLGLQRPADWSPRGKGHKDRARQYGVAYEVVDRIAVFERDGWLCMLCLTPVDREARWPDPRSASLDHVVPMIKGGPHTYSNVWCAHLFCNISKGAR